MRINYAIVSVSDMQRSVAFYRDVLALPLRFESPGWTEFSTEGATLALHAATGAGTGRDEAARLAPGRCRPGFGVADLDVFHRRMVASGSRYCATRAPKTGVRGSLASPRWRRPGRWRACQ